MPEVMQIEVLKCLETLQIQIESGDGEQQSIDIKAIKEKYLQLAREYHPDVVQNRLEQSNAAVAAGEESEVLTAE